MYQLMDGYRYVTIEHFELTKKLQGRGPKKHMKRLAAPKHWMLDKLLGM